MAIGPMSVACEACTGSCVSRSFALTNNCHRDCFFCFNPNQEDFAYWCERPFPWRRQLDDLAAEPGSPACIALTGGEPLLMADEAVAFFSRASELFPAAHLRLYTSGDLLSRELIDRLVRAGLHEIRFSVKQDDKPELLEKVLERMAWAREQVPTVMVEMPVIPGTDSFMKEL
ncbi:MAG: radical SAM protein, partial [Adlercreutzia sp.]